MSIFDAPDPHSVSSEKPAPSLTDNLSELPPAEFLPQSVGMHSGELTSLSKSAECHGLPMRVIDILCDELEVSGYPLS